jgi:hypothetical protein
MTDKKQEGRHRKSSDEPSLNVPIPEQFTIIKVYLDPDKSISTEELAELIERALNLDKTPLFAKSDTVCITLVKQGGPSPIGPGPGN